MGFANEYAYNSAATRERSIIKNVYLWMTAGLALTGVVAYGISNNPSLMRSIVTNPILFFGVMIAELGLVMYLSARIMSMSVQGATLAFALYSALNGVTMSVIFLAYTGATITLAFFTTAANPAHNEKSTSKRCVKTAFYTKKPFYIHHITSL